MTQGFEISGPAGAVALLLPLAALATVILLALKKGRGAGGRAASRHERGGTSRLGGQGAPFAAKRPPLPSGAPAAETAHPRLVLVKDGLEARASAVTRAEATGDERELVGVYLALARELLAQGRLDEAESNLTKCIRLAAKLGHREAHAEARRERGDLARASGDLTSACEHWQIARGLFHELRQATAVAEIEARMHQYGCPTDWVLNDF